MLGDRVAGEGQRRFEHIKSDLQPSIEVRAAARGVSDRTLNEAFEGSEFVPRIVELDRRQPDAAAFGTPGRMTMVGRRTVRPSMKPFRV